jgi:hypothetical protein
VTGMDWKHSYKCHDLFTLSKSPASMVSRLSATSSSDPDILNKLMPLWSTCLSFDSSALMRSLRAPTDAFDLIEMSNPSSPPLPRSQQ